MGGLLEDSSKSPCARPSCGVADLLAGAGPGKWGTQGHYFPPKGPGPSLGPVQDDDWTTTGRHSGSSPRAQPRRTRITAPRARYRHCKQSESGDHHRDGGSGRSPARACSSADTEGSALATRTCRPEPGVERSRLTAAPACGRGSGPSGEPHLESPGPAGSETLSHPDGDSESQTRLETRINRQSDLPRHPSRNYFPAVRLGRTNLTQIRAAAAAWPGLQ